MKPDRALVLLVLLPLVWPAAAGAAEYVFHPHAQMRTEYVKNQTLSTDSSQDNDSLLLLAEAWTRFIYRTPRTQVRLDPRLTLRQSDNSAFDGSDQSLYLTAVHRKPRHSYSLSGEYLRASTIVSELVNIIDLDPPVADDPPDDPVDPVDPPDIPPEDPVDDPGDEPVDDTGSVEARATRTRLSLQPSVSFDLGERSGVRVTGMHTDVDFGGQTGFSLTDYEDNSISLGWFRRLSQRNDFSAAVQYGRFKAPATSYLADSVSLNLRYTRFFSELWRASISAGFQTSDIEVGRGFFASQRSDDSLLLAVNATRSMPRGWIRLLARRAVGPNGSGFLVTRNEAAVTASRRFSQYINGQVGVRVFESDEFAQFGNPDERDYTVAETSMSWRPARDWTIGARYSWRSQDLETAGSATSNVVSVFATRSFSRRSWSR